MGANVEKDAIERQSSYLNEQGNLILASLS